MVRMTGISEHVKEGGGKFIPEESTDVMASSTMTVKDAHQDRSWAASERWESD